VRDLRRGRNTLRGGSYLFGNEGELVEGDDAVAVLVGLGDDGIGLARDLCIVRGKVVGLEDFKQLGLGDNAIALLIKGHEGKLEFVFLACARVIGDTDEKLKGRRKRKKGRGKGVRRRKTVG
jgi:hypothetical protein